MIAESLLVLLTTRIGRSDVSERSTSHPFQRHRQRRWLKARVRQQRSCSVSKETRQIVGRHSLSPVVRQSANRPAMPADWPHPWAANVRKRTNRSGPAAHPGPRALVASTSLARCARSSVPFYGLEDSSFPVLYLFWITDPAISLRIGSGGRRISRRCTGSGRLRVVSKQETRWRAFLWS